MKGTNRIYNYIMENEGCSLTAYKCVESEKYYTIGYGHYGVSKNAKITKKEAIELFYQDIKKFENYVNNSRYNKIIDKCNQDMFDALLSFCYNCGCGNLQKLTSHKIEDIASTILQYNKCGGKVLPGLVRRRNYESDLFVQGLSKLSNETKIGIKKGDKVKVVKNLIYGTDKTFKVYKKEYDVIEIKGNRVVIGIGNVVTTAIDVSNIKKVE